MAGNSSKRPVVFWISLSLVQPFHVIAEGFIFIAWQGNRMCSIQSIIFLPAVCLSLKDIDKIAHHQFIGTLILGLVYCCQLSLKRFLKKPSSKPPTCGRLVRGAGHLVHSLYFFKEGKARHPIIPGQQRF